MTSAHPGAPGACRQRSDAALLFINAKRPSILGTMGIAEIEKCAVEAHGRASALSRKAVIDIRAELRSEGRDVSMYLESHRSRMRSIRAQIVLLRRGYVPALKLDGRNEKMREQALAIMAGLYSHFEAMQYNL